MIENIVIVAINNTFSKICTAALYLPLIFFAIESIKPIFFKEISQYTLKIGHSKSCYINYALYFIL